MWVVFHGFRFASLRLSDVWGRVAFARNDGTAQSRVMEGIMQARQGKGLIWALHRASLARGFDRVIVMATGNVVEQGTVADLDKDGTALRKLVEAE